MKQSNERIDSLKNRLRAALSARNMKAADLCERTGIPKGAVSYYMAGKSQPKADRVHLMSTTLGVSEAWLMGFDVPMERTEAQKKNDDLVQVIAKLRKDPDFFEVVSILASLKPDDYASIKQLVSALGNK